MGDLHIFRQGNPQCQSQSSKLVVTGDYIVESPADAPKISQNLHRYLEDTDHVITNIEAPHPSAGSPTAKAGPVLEGSENAIETLSEWGCDAATLANNHIMDYSWEGLRSTLQECNKQGIKTTGAGENHNEAIQPLRFMINGQDVVVINMCEKEFSIATEKEPGAAWINHPSMDEHLQKTAQDADCLIVIAHGGIEYIPIPPPTRQQRFREFVDAGADIVIGHHPHVPQGWEIYKGTPLIYSLGNFVFNQPKRSNADQRMLAELTFSEAGLDYVKLKKVERINNSLCLINHEQQLSDYQEFLQRSSEIVSDRKRLEDYWKKIARRLFHQRYTRYLRSGTGARLRDQLLKPLQHLDEQVLFNGNTRQPELLLLLNLFRNESHRDCIMTGIAIESGTEPVPDEPTENEVSELLSWTEDQPSSLGWLPFRTRLNTLVRKLKF
jgi:poly-gamma-glutamate synthesis protein (capsule biosynthesis protein)